jgi:CBS domain-containing protein
MRVERIPIRTTTQIEGDGTYKQTLSIYCPFRGASFTTEHCRVCPKLVAWAEDAASPEAAVICASDDVPEAARAVALHLGDRLSGRFDDVGAHTPIGVVMDRTTLAVSEEVDLDALRRELGAATGRVLPVVDAGGRLLGVVASDRLRSSVPPRDRAHSVAEMLSRVAAKSVSEVMTAHVVAFPEGGRIRDALNVMIVERVRYLPIVTEHGELVGMVWDIDLLSWLARSDRGRGDER